MGRRSWFPSGEWRACAGKKIGQFRVPGKADERVERETYNGRRLGLAHASSERPEVDEGVWILSLAEIRMALARSRDVRIRREGLDTLSRRACSLKIDRSRVPSW